MVAKLFVLTFAALCAVAVAAPTNSETLRSLQSSILPPNLNSFSSPRENVLQLGLC